VDVEVTSRRPVTTGNAARMNPTSSGCPIPPQSVGSARDDRERVVHLAWGLAALTNPARLRSRAPPLMASPMLDGVAPLPTKRAGRARATPDPFIARATESHPGSLKHSSPGPETCQPKGRASIDCVVGLCFRQSLFGFPIDPGPNEVPYAIRAGGLGQTLLGVEPRRPLVSTSAKLRQVLTIRGESWTPKLLR
jgi:hypothetical protein